MLYRVRGTVGFAPSPKSFRQSKKYLKEKGVRISSKCDGLSDGRNVHVDVSCEFEAENDEAAKKFAASWIKREREKVKKRYRKIEYPRAFNFATLIYSLRRIIRRRRVIEISEKSKEIWNSGR